MTQIDLANSRTHWPVRVLLKRGIWELLGLPLCRYLPRWLNPARIAVLRLMGAKIGGSCLLMPGLRVLVPWNLHLEDHVAIGRDVQFYNHAEIRVQRMSVISQDTVLCTSSHDYTHPTMPLIFSPILVGSECWVAAGAFLGPGVRLGCGSVVGARAVVTRDVDPWVVVAGNPARFIKERKVQTDAGAAAARPAGAFLPSPSSSPDACSDRRVHKEHT